MRSTTTSSLVFACHTAACRPPGSGGTGGSSPSRSMSHIQGVRARNAILKELDDQGLPEDNPLRHIFKSVMSDQVLVIRDAKGHVVGGVQYQLDKAGQELNVRDMRILPEQQGYGTAAFIEMAKVAVEHQALMMVRGAVSSAKPFYAKQGAIFQNGSSMGWFTDEATKALAQGKPIQGTPGTTWDEWAKHDFLPPKKVRKPKAIIAACHSKACAPPPAGHGGSDLVKSVRSVLTDDLRNAPYKGSCNPMTGHCYVASEALYHAMGGAAAGLKPMFVKHEGSPHWFLKTKDGGIIDPTADQFKTPVPYHLGKGKGFLTKQPSKRAREVLDRVGLK